MVAKIEQNLNPSWRNCSAVSRNVPGGVRWTIWSRVLVDGGGDDPSDIFIVSVGDENNQFNLTNAFVPGNRPYAESACVQATRFAVIYFLTAYQIPKPHFPPIRISGDCNEPKCQ